VLAELSQHHRQVAVSLGEIGPQLQGTPEVIDRFRRTARRLDRQTKSAQSLGIIRIQLEGSATAANRALQLADVPEGFGQCEME
jgi:hypothetical protein